MTQYGPHEAEDSARLDCPEESGTDATEVSLPEDQAVQPAADACPVEGDATDKDVFADAPHAETDRETDNPDTADAAPNIFATVTAYDLPDPAEDEADSWDNFDAAKLATIASSGHDPVPIIRDIVSRNAAETAAAQPDAAPEPAADSAGDAAVRSHRARRAHRMDRWASLRDAFSETGGDAPESADAEMVHEPQDDAPSTPLDRIRAREASKAPAPMEFATDPTEDFTFYDDSVFGGSGTDETGAPPPVEAEVLPNPSQGPMFGAVEARVWDTPADNEMSRGGRLAWRIAVYGSLVAAPLVLLLTSPFAPKDAVAHYVAAAGCTAAGYAGLAPAKVGTPGYHAHLDENGNGIACEPTVQRTLKGNGQVAFIRVGDHQ